MKHLDEMTLAELLASFDQAPGQPAHAMRVKLEGGGAFWSKGWRGCDFTREHRADDWNVPLMPFAFRENGVLRAGWACVTPPPKVAYAIPFQELL